MLFRSRIWFNEYLGALKIYDPKTKRVTLVAEMEVFKTLENGFLAFALDPKFAQNGWIYILYSPVGFEGQYLSRFDVKDDKLVAGSEKVILKYEEQRLQCCHHGATIKFGPDGCLYFTAGDNTSPFGDSQGYAPLDQRQIGGQPGQLVVVDIPDVTAAEVEHVVEDHVVHLAPVERVIPRSEPTLEGAGREIGRAHV